MHNIRILHTKKPLLNELIYQRDYIALSEEKVFFVSTDIYFNCCTKSNFLCSYQFHCNAEKLSVTELSQAVLPISLLTLIANHVCISWRDLHFDEGLNRLKNNKILASFRVGPRVYKPCFKV